jgi:uncharacterized protein (TIGR03084 family)
VATLLASGGLANYLATIKTVNEKIRRGDHPTVATAAEEDAMSLTSACEDLVAEAAALRRLLDARDDLDPLAVTPFHGWRVRDTIAHLALIDRLARLTMTEPEAFEVELARFGEGTRATDAAAANEAVFGRIAAYEDSRLGDLDWTRLLAAWDAGLSGLRGAAASFPDDARVKWFGASMRLETLLNARQMEVWAYGQDVFDLYGAARPETDSLRNIAEFAVRTFGFSFANRGLPVPAQRPYLALVAPSGALWTWNDPDAPERIEGTAVDFCAVATQRRHRDDTGLSLHGATAETWMRIAQCIAGPPVDGPRPGERAGAARGPA